MCALDFMAHSVHSWIWNRKGGKVGRETKKKATREGKRARKKEREKDGKCLHVRLVLWRDICIVGYGIEKVEEREKKRWLESDKESEKEREREKERGKESEKERERERGKNVCVCV